MPDIAFVLGKSGYCGERKGSLRDSWRVDRYGGKRSTFSGCHGGFRYHGTYVPVEDGRFKYVLELPHVEGYKLIFVTKNPEVWYTVPFIVEEGKLHITVNADKITWETGRVF